MKGMKIMKGTAENIALAKLAKNAKKGRKA